MTFQLSSAQRDQLEILLDSATSGNYASVYDYIFECMTDGYGASSEAPKTGVEQSVWLWQWKDKKIRSFKM